MQSKLRAATSLGYKLCKPNTLGMNRDTIDLLLLDQ
jgi:hypothetical protein